MLSFGFPPPTNRPHSVVLLGIRHWFKNALPIPRLQVAPKRFLALLSPGQETASERRIVPPHIQDFGSIQELVNECYQCHKSCRTYATGQVVPGLRVIDCSSSSVTPVVVLAPESCRYVALSYVWGKVCHDDQKPAPIVVQDAMSVTRALGLRFLWVDKYCIPQDGVEKHRFIRAMDRIYSNAYLTVIAAAGESSHDGLPGVSQVSRKRQVEVRVAQCTLLELPYGFDATKASTWATRAWTYQEGYLSTRCLVFTDVGLVYLCSEVHLEESVQQLAPEQTSAFITERNRREYSWMFKKEDVFPISTSLELAITEYTKRELTFQEDSLKAFSGILNYYYQGLHSGGRVDNIWGVPAPDGIPHLDWLHRQKAIRRPNFPSWSWAGWAGAVEFHDFWADQQTWYSDPLLEPFSAAIPSEPVGHQAHDTASTSSSASSAACSRRLFVTGPVMPLRFATPVQTEHIITSVGDHVDYLAVTAHPGEHFCMIELYPGIFTAALSMLNSEPEDDTMLGLLVTERVISPADEWQEGKPYPTSFRIKKIIILKQVSDHYERIGYAFWDYICPNVYLDGEDVFFDRDRLPTGGRDTQLLLLNNVKRIRICLE
ncbi:putative tol protein [Cladorrhinum sp. PSN259]|nr:putative tol protein [Cladorrhinum sp. PSN259]